MLIVLIKTILWSLVCGKTELYSVLDFHNLDASSSVKFLLSFKEHPLFIHAYSQMEPHSKLFELELALVSKFGLFIQVVSR